VAGGFKIDALDLGGGRRGVKGKGRVAGSGCCACLALGKRVCSARRGGVGATEEEAVGGGWRSWIGGVCAGFVEAACAGERWGDGRSGGPPAGAAWVVSVRRSPRAARWCTALWYQIGVAAAQGRGNDLCSVRTVTGGRKT
jgi:hypothetical protein